VHPMGQFNLEGAPQILLVSNDRHPDGRPVGIADAGRYWHTDMSYMKEPALGSLLYARAIPDAGGDTMFCDMTAACADLPPDMRRKLAGLEGEVLVIGALTRIELWNPETYRKYEKGFGLTFEEVAEALLEEPGDRAPEEERGSKGRRR